MELDPKEYFDKNDYGGFVSLHKDAPEELLDYVREAHGPDYPAWASLNKWVWNKCKVFWDALCEGQELVHEVIDYEVDIHDRDLFVWLSEDPERRSFCDEAVNAGTIKEADLVQIIKGGQYHMIKMIADTMELAYMEFVGCA